MIMVEGGSTMALDYSAKDHTKKEKTMINYLMNEFCHDSYERDEMMKWINQKNVEYVYKTVKKLFLE